VSRLKGDMVISKSKISDKQFWGIGIEAIVPPPAQMSKLSGIVRV